MSPPQNPPVIGVQGLCKAFGAAKATALGDVYLQV